MTKMKKKGDIIQTFLPYNDFKKSAECLDYKRLGNQRNESNVIIEILQGKRPNSRWINHPAIKMWKGYTKALCIYYNTIVSEWEKRGYKNNMQKYVIVGWVDYPKWFGRKDFHNAHKSNLLRKNPEFYGKYHWDVPDNLPYVWT